MQVTPMTPAEKSVEIARETSALLDKRDERRRERAELEREDKEKQEGKNG